MSRSIFGRRILVRRLVILQLEGIFLPQFFHGLFAGHRFTARIPGVAFFIQHAAGFHQRLPVAVAELVLLHRTPRVAAAVNDAFAGDGDIFQIFTGNRRGGIHFLFALQVNHRQRIQFVVAGKLDERAAFEVQVDVASQPDRPGEPEPGGTTSSPPPFSASAASAAANAPVFSFMPSPAAPKSESLTTFGGINGAATCGKTTFPCGQASDAQGGKHDGVEPGEFTGLGFGWAAHGGILRFFQAD